MRALARGLAVVIFSVSVAVDVHAATRVTTDLIPAKFGRQGTVSRGKILFMSDNDVYLHDGTNSNLVQPLGALTGLADNVFALGSGSAPGQVVAGWRRDTDFAWVSVDGGTPVEVDYTNPFNAANPMNPEEVAIADGCVFFGLQAPVTDPDNNALMAQTVARIDLATGAATILTGSAPVAGRFSRISTSQCKAVWIWWNAQYANDDPDIATMDVHYYNGSALSTIDSGVGLGRPVIAQGRIFYTKKDGNGIGQLFMYDTTAPSPSVVQLTAYTSGSIGPVVSDGRFVVWNRGTPGGNARHLYFYPGVRLTDATNRPGEELQMHRGHLFWMSTTGGYWVNSEAGTVSVSTSPSTSPATPKLGDGVVAWTGLANDGGTDGEIFKHDIGTPSALPPPRLVRATPTLGRTVTLTFAQIIGATHNVYMAQQAGVTRSNYGSLTGGRAFLGVTSGFTTPVLANGTYYFVVTAVENGVEGTESSEVTASLNDGQWVPSAGSWDLEFWDVKADRQNGSILYGAAATSGLWKSTDGGSTWTGPLPIDRPGNDVLLNLDIRAVAADGNTVVAVSKDGDLYRSTDAGGTWTRVFDGEDIGESQKVLVIDPVNPAVMFAGDTKAAGAVGISNYIVKSLDGGATWTQLPNSAAGEIRAYALAGDPAVANRYLAAGTALPVVVSADGGATWAERTPAPGLYQAGTVAATSPSSMYVSGTTFSNGDFDGLGVYKSVDAGLNWTLKNTGLPVPIPRVYTLFADPAAPASIHAGSVGGYYRSTNGGDNWSLGPSAGQHPSASLTSIRSFATTASRRLIAAASTGIYVSPLLAGPTLTSVSPPSGSTAGGTTVTLTGTGFQAGATVLFDSTPATAVMVSGATSIQANTPAHASGTVAVHVINPDGQTATLAAAFTYTATAPAPPTGVVATAQTTTSVLVTWLAAESATSYEIWRKSGPGLFQFVGPSSGTSFTDSTVSPSTAYLYAVKAVNEVGTSSQSVANIATTVIFTNEPLGAGVVIQAAHLSQLRGAIDAVRFLAGYTVPYTFTDAASAGVPIRAVHVTELRSALDEALSLLGFSAGGYTDATLSGVPVKAIHHQELRDRIK